MEKEPVDNYKPLDSKKNEIRLLRLKPCQYNRDNKQDEQRIICFLEHRSLEDKIEYIALSYAWENGLERQEISVSGNECSVSANLVDALRQLRQDFDELVIWTDQLCINQDDSAEKASQIQKMRSIYEGATMVIAWLLGNPSKSERRTQFPIVLLPPVLTGAEFLWQEKKVIAVKIKTGRVEIRVIRIILVCLKLN